MGPDRIPGVIGLKPVHLLEQGEDEKVVKIDQLLVDIGAKGKEEAQRLAPLGTPMVFATRFEEVGALVKGKSFDDRAGCAVLAELVRGERLPHDLHGVFTVQEEVGLRGSPPTPAARTAPLPWRAPSPTTCPKRRTSARHRS